MDPNAMEQIDFDALDPIQQEEPCDNPIIDELGMELSSMPTKHQKTAENDQPNNTTPSVNWQEITSFQKSKSIRKRPAKININPPPQDEDPNPITLFRKFFDSKVLNLLINYTIGHTDYLRRNYNICYKKSKAMEERISPTEMETFIGIWILIGLVKIPYMSDYWSNSELYSNKVISSAMPRDRFEALYDMLHLSCSNCPNQCIENLLPIANKIRMNFQKNVNPGKRVCIKEVPIPYKDKPRGIHTRIFGVYDCSLSYLWNFAFVRGSYTEIENNLGKNTILNLVDGLESRDCHLYFGKRHSSVSLAIILNNLGINFTAKIDRNEGCLPPKTKRSSIPKYYSCRNILYCAWTDKRPKHFISNRENINNETKNKQKNSDCQSKPKFALKYDKYMDGPIEFNKYISTTEKLSGRVWKTIFNFLIQAAIINSFIIYNRFTGTKKTKRNRLDIFKKSLGLDLIRYNAGGEKDQTEESLGKMNQHRKCAHCSGQRFSRTDYKCKVCDKPCHVKCYEAHMVVCNADRLEE